MDENRAGTPEQVIEFAPKGGPRSHGTLVEEAGEAIIAKIQKAADLSNENCDRAMKLAHKLSMQFQSRRRSNKSIRGRGRTLPGPRGPRRTLAANNSGRNRGEAHRSEISQRHRTNLASQRRRAMTSVETHLPRARRQVSGETARREPLLEGGRTSATRTIRRWAKGKQSILPCLSAIVAPRAPMGFGIPVVVSHTV